MYSNNEERKLVHEIEHRLAVDLQHLLCDDAGSKYVWTDTTLHLMEVVYYLYKENLMINNYGTNYTKKRIAEMACKVFGKRMPANIGTYLTRVRTMKGQRSHTLVDMNIYRIKHDGCYFGLTESVEKKCVSDA